MNIELILSFSGVSKKIMALFTTENKDYCSQTCYYVTLCIFDLEHLQGENLNKPLYSHITISLKVRNLFNFLR